MAPVARYTQPGQETLCNGMTERKGRRVRAVYAGHCPSSWLRCQMEFSTAIIRLESLEKGDEIRLVFHEDMSLFCSVQAIGARILSSGRPVFPFW